MFTGVPAADAYTMKMILHDWNDEQCVQILQSVHRSALANSRIFVVEHVISTESAQFATLFDLHMMCWGAGRERSEREYVDLLHQAGWKHKATWYPANKDPRCRRGFEDLSCDHREFEPARRLAPGNGRAPRGQG